MARSDGDSDYERRRRKKKKDRRRSRSRSVSSNDRSSSGRKRSRKSSRERKRSHSRSRSRSRDRSSRRTHRSRSKSRSRSRDRTRRHRDRERSRSSSRDRSSRSHHYSDDESTKSSSKSKSKHEKGLVHSGATTAASSDDKDLSLKDKIKALSVKNNEASQPPVEPTYKPSEQELARIEKDSFVQEHFSKTYNQPNAPPQQGKKKKKKKKQQQLQLLLQQQQQQNAKNKVAPSDNTNTCNVTEPRISHDDAIFGTASDTMFLSNFSSRIDTKRREELRTKEETNQDLIFGAMFFEKPEVRMKRWIQKLETIRKRLRESERKRDNF